MKESISRNLLDQSIELTSDLNLNEKDYEKIFEKFKLILENGDVKNLIENVSNKDEFKNEDDLKMMMKELSNAINLADLNKLLNNIIKNEELIDFIQDLILEKLI
ncbi:MAG: hypothetical protein EU548_09790 [Promethearchaeota archaeon]|nr:MAG: hypothetical protein EU548_09790 [Candidatus Lokiarchaeota archaeon]